MMTTMIPTATEADAQYVFEEWHRATTSRDVEALIALYDDDAVMETPMAVLLLGTGLLTGHAEVARFLRANFAQRQTVIPSMSAVRFHRTGHYQFDGRTLTWEYLRATPAGDSFDVSEVLELRGRKIAVHRIYFGWFAFRSLLEGAKAR
jgi:steroid delta-isomerase